MDRKRLILQTVEKAIKEEVGAGNKGTTHRFKGTKKLIKRYEEVSRLPIGSKEDVLDELFTQIIYSIQNPDTSSENKNNVRMLYRIYKEVLAEFADDTKR